MRERGAVRLIPRHPVSVEIMTIDIAAARGMLANISELGACVWTEEAFDSGDALVLRLGFRGEINPFQVAGRVVWSDRPGVAGDLRRCGLRWAHTGGPHHERLKTLITDC
jgi:Tfp pilus assembly protein PilZ